MPSGKTHAAVSTLTAAVIATGTLIPGADKPMLLAASVGCLSGVLLSPDLDVDHGHIGFRVAKRYFGSIFHAAWKWAWKPYALLVPHRSYISHIPVAGAFLRLMYLYIVYLIVGTLLFYAVGWPTVHYLPLSTMVIDVIRGTASLQLQLLAAAFTGLCISDTLHLVMDGSSTSFKRRFGRRSIWQFIVSDVGLAILRSLLNTR